MFISDFIFKKIYDFSIECYKKQSFKLLRPDKYHLAKIDFRGVDVEVVNNFKSLEQNDIPAFWCYTKVNKSGLQNNQTFALLKTSTERAEYVNNIGIVLYCKLESIVLLKHLKWFKISLPVKAISIQQQNTITVDYSLLRSSKITDSKTPNQPPFKYIKRALGNLSNKELIDFYNDLLYQPHNEERAVYLTSLHRMFQYKFNRSPITVRNGKELFLSHKIYYSKELDSFINPKLN